MRILSLILLLFTFIQPALAREELPPELNYANTVIRSTYGDEVDFISKAKTLLKFGRNDNIGTSLETVWLNGGDETYVDTNLINRISSSDNGDTQSVVVEGHTCSGSGTDLQLTFVVQSVTLVGQTSTALSTSLCRTTRLYNNDSTDFAGTVYVYQSGQTVTAGVPQDSTKIHLQTDGTNNQSLKAATAVEDNNYWIATEFVLGVNRQNSRSVDYRLQVRNAGKVFRTRFPGSCHTNAGTCAIPIKPPLIIPENSDVRIRAISSGADTGVTASINGYLAQVNE